MAQGLGGAHLQSSEAGGLGVGVRVYWGEARGQRVDALHAGDDSLRHARGLVRSGLDISGSQTFMGVRGRTMFPGGKRIREDNAWEETGTRMPKRVGELGTGVGWGHGCEIFHKN